LEAFLLPATAARPHPQITGRQLRTVSSPLQVRAAASADGPIPFSGHAIVYDSWTTVYDWFGEYQERIARGAAARALAEDDVRLLMNHDANYVLARKRGEDGDTLRLSEDSVGLLAEADMAPTSFARDLAISMARGDVSGMSFAFEVLQEEWDTRPDGMWMRTIQEIRLYDVSIVTYPAYDQTDAGLRTLLRSDLPTRKAFAELLLREEAPAKDVPTDEDTARSRALAEDEAHHHRAVAAILGMAR
jgi:HK97 family phage prohead protease